MRPFDYVAPLSIDEAVHALTQGGAGARILAGGTDLLVELKEASAGPSMLVDVGGIPDLHGIEEAPEGLRIGAAVTHSEIMGDPLILRHVPAMATAAHSIGAIQTRNRGTIGGNLVTGVPSMDSGPALLALDAVVTLVGPNGRRRLALEEFFAGPRQTELAAGEILVDILIPSAMLGRPCAFWKFGLRKGQALAVVNAAASLSLDGGESVVDARIALGAVAPTVIRVPQAEEHLIGWFPGGDSDLPALAARVASEDARPIDDFRASAAYRRQLIEVGVRRVLAAASGSEMATWP